MQPMAEPKPQAVIPGITLSGVFLITGGTRGIGRAISVEFARAGAHVIANYLRNETTAGELRALADAENVRLDLCRADLTTPQGLQLAATTVRQAGSPLSGLVHCAAIGAHRPFAELTVRHLDWTMALNVRSFFELVKLLLPDLVAGASIVAVSSPGASRAVPDYAIVGASKGALESLARHLAVELAPRGIRTNILAPERLPPTPGRRFRAGKPSWPKRQEDHRSDGWSRPRKSPERPTSCARRPLRV